MIRARRYQDARAQARSNPELAWWVFMRVSGVVLIFLVLGHIYMTFLLTSELQASYSVVVNQLAQPVWKIYDWLMLTLAMLHGVNGARYSIDDYVQKVSRRVWTKTLVYGLAALIYVLGTMGLFIISKAMLAG
jgi:succinate dehydrogenase / fumarate reductase membrane anchor subunit